MQKVLISLDAKQLKMLDLKVKKLKKSHIKDLTRSDLLRLALRQYLDKYSH